MNQNALHKKVFIHGLPIAIVLLAIFLRINAGPRTIDDSYITYRYSRNILAGNGFVFNPGERVLGTTTPLYTFLLTLLALPFGGTQANYPILSYLFNAIVDGATCILLYQLGRKLNSTIIGVAISLAYALAPYSVTFSIGGLETSVYLFLLVGTCYFYLNEKFEMAALIAALAFLTRPDALILILPMIADYLIYIYLRIRKLNKDTYNKNNPYQDTLRFIRTAALFLVPCAIWLVFAYFYFGSLFPNSITAKAIAYRLPENSALVRLLQHYATPFSEDIPFGSFGIAFGLFFYPSLAAFGGLHLFRKSNRTLPMTIYPWLYFIIFSIANPLIFRWYLTPPIPFYFLCIFTGITTLWEQLFSHQRRQTTLWKLFSISTTAIIPSLLILPAWQPHPSHGPNRLAPEMAYIQLELHYEQAAHYLKSNFQRDPAQITIAAGDVGVLGYLTNANILDTVGLNSPQTLPYFPLDPQNYVINYAVPTQLILDYLPDYVVILEVYGRNTLLKSKIFWQLYKLAHKIESDIYGSDGLLILEKKTP